MSLRLCFYIAAVCTVGYDLTLTSLTPIPICSIMNLVLSVFIFIGMFGLAYCLNRLTKRDSPLPTSSPTTHTIAPATSQQVAAARQDLQDHHHKL